MKASNTLLINKLICPPSLNWRCSVMKLQSEIHIRDSQDNLLARDVTLLHIQPKFYSSLLFVSHYI